jgi:hypothetical protein
MLPLLTAGSVDHPSFHVVAPSIPGYAWSEGVLEKGFHAEHYAKVNRIYLHDLSRFRAYDNHLHQPSSSTS